MNTNHVFISLMLRKNHDKILTDNLDLWVVS